MNFLYPQYCNDPKYVQSELTDEDFFSCIKESEAELKDFIAKKDYNKAWDMYLAKIGASLENRCFYKLSESEAIKHYVQQNFSSDEIEKVLSTADDLTEYRFHLQEDDPFVFSDKKITWNSYLGNSPYNQLILTYMSYLGQLGIAYIITGDDKYVSFFAETINDFIATCPYRKPTFLHMNAQPTQDSVQAPDSPGLQALLRQCLAAVHSIRESKNES